MSNQDEHFADNGEPRTHPVSWVPCRKRGCVHSLGTALGINTDRSAVTDDVVNGLIERNASLRDIVHVLSEREMTDAEFATALYALGWYDRGIRGGEENDA